MIVCVTPNPALDHTLTVERVIAGEVMRATHSRLTAGGKGLNVARAVRTLGGDPLCTGFLGGNSGKLLAMLAKSEGLNADWTWVNGDTRTCVILVSADGCDATVINEPGPHVTTSDWSRFQSGTLSSVGSETICFCGSLPAGSLLDDWEQLLVSISAGRPVWVDTSGETLRRALRVAGVNIKINGTEAGDLLGYPVHDFAAAIEAAGNLRSRGASTVVLTLGTHGAVFANGSGVHHALAPSVKAVNSVGSGDSFLAGLLVALTAGASTVEALRWAVAAGAANACSSGGGHFTRDEFEKMLAVETTIKRLS